MSAWRRRRWPACRRTGRRKLSWPRGWRGSSTWRASPRSTSPTGWGSAGSGSPGCSTPRGRAGSSASRSACQAACSTRACPRSCAPPSACEHAFVFNFPEDESPLRQRLGEAAGQVLMDLIKPGDVLGLTWSRTLSGLTAALTQLPPCPIVQLTGAVPPPDGRDLLELVRSVARVGGGTAHVFYAPMLRRRRRDGGGDPPPGRHRRGVRAHPQRDHRGRRPSARGSRAVDDLRRHDARRSARRSTAARRPRGARRGVHRRGRRPARDRRWTAG